MEGGRKHISRFYTDIYGLKRLNQPYLGISSSPIFVVGLGIE